MKRKILLVLVATFGICFAVRSQTIRQVPLSDFDPSVHPVAVQLDTNLVLTTVSDYVLIKSLYAQLPDIGKITKVRCIQEGRNYYLRYESDPVGADEQKIFVLIPLVRSVQGNYFISNNSGTTCKGTCNCGQGCSCCTTVPPSSTGRKVTLKRVTSLIEPFQKE